MTIVATAANDAHIKILVGGSEVRDGGVSCIGSRERSDGVELEGKVLEEPPLSGGQQLSINPKPVFCELSELEFADLVWKEKARCVFASVHE